MAADGNLRTNACSMLIVLRGGGDLGTGVAHRLHRAGFRVAITELAEPLVIRRAVAFASAVFDLSIEVEGVRSLLAQTSAEALECLARGLVPVLIDPAGTCIDLLRPDALVDARMAKRNLGTRITDAPLVVGLGPGFTAGHDVHAVIETARGHDLGRVLLTGAAKPDTHMPGPVQGLARERVLAAPRSGTFRARASIGQRIEAGQVVAEVGGQQIWSTISGVLRGILHDGLTVLQGQKVGDIDPRGVVEHCFTISDKARAIGGGVLEAILYLRQHLTTPGSSDKLY
jgi:xanthine dehydrogenase accessory factor